MLFYQHKSTIKNHKFSISMLKHQLITVNFRFLQNPPIWRRFPFQRPRKIVHLVPVVHTRVQISPGKGLQQRFSLFVAQILNVRCKRQIFAPLNHRLAGHVTQEPAISGLKNTQLLARQNHQTILAIFQQRRRADGVEFQFTLLQVVYKKRGRNGWEFNCAIFQVFQRNVGKFADFWVDFYGFVGKVGKFYDFSVDFTGIFKIWQIFGVKRRFF